MFYFTGSASPRSPDVSSPGIGKPTNNVTLIVKQKLEKGIGKEGSSQSRSFETLDDYFNLQKPKGKSIVIRTRIKSKVNLLGRVHKNWQFIT